MAPSKTQPALLGGLMIGVLSALPVINIANCCCAWILFGGALAAYLMQQGHPEPVSAGDGAVVGLMAGVVGAVVWLVASLAVQSVTAPFQSAMIERVLANSTDMAPEAREFLRSLSAGGGAVGIGTIFVFFVMLCVSSLFGMIGGLFGAMMFRKAAAPPPPPPFAPPPIPGSGF